MGLFDPEGFTMNYGQYESKVMNGLVLTTYGTWTQPNPAICGDTAICTLLPGAFPVLPGVYNDNLPTGYGACNARCITTNCKYPERAMHLLNFFESTDGARLLANGIKGKDWDVIDGKPQIIGERLNLVIAGTNTDYDIENGIGTMVQNWTSGSTVPEDGYPVFLNLSKDFISKNATAAQKAFAQDFDKSFSYPGQAYDLWIKNGIATTVTDYPLAVDMMGVSSDATGQVEANAGEYVMANISKLIMADNDADFNAVKASVIAALKAMGLEAADKEVQDIYAKAQQEASSVK
jgi:hypothetical protein